MYLEVKFNFRNISLNKFFDPGPKKWTFNLGRKYKGFPKLIKGKNFRNVFLNFYF